MSDVAVFLRDGTTEPLELWGALGAATGGWARINRVTVSSQLMTRRLGMLLGRVAAIGDEWVRLSYNAPDDPHKGSGIYRVETIERPPASF